MTTERKNISLTLSVPPDTRKKLRQLAVDREQSLSEIVIELIKRESDLGALSDTTTKDNS